MSTVPLVVHVDDLDRHTTAQFAFLRSPVRLGRGELNDLQLDEPYVSTWHGVIQFDEDGIRIVDLGSTNGTWLDGVRLERNVPAVVGAGAELRIGSLRLGLARRAVDQQPAPRPFTQFALRAGAASAEGAAQAPPPQAAPPPVDDPAAREAVEAASWQLGILTDAFQQARDNLDAAVAQAVVALPPDSRRRALALLAERFPALAAAPAPTAGAAPAAPLAAPFPSGDPSVELVRAFAESYLPAGSALDRPETLKVFLGALAEVLETSVKSYLELRRGYGEFGREMGIRVPQGEGAVGRFRDAGPLLSYLLDPAATEPRARELASAFADLMIHQVALLNGVTEGAKDLLARLSPEEITAGLEREGGAGRLSLGVKTLREGAQWRAYVARYAELAEEEGALSDALFGKAFARAYSAVAGRRGGGDGEGAGGEDRDATPRPAGPGGSRAR